jgi:phosphoribosylanthranilate isomerase
MPLKLTVKVGSITNLSDARYCAGMNVPMLGFVTVPSRQNFIPPSQFQDIRGWISGPSIVAEAYGILSTKEYRDLLEAYRPDYIELSTAEIPYVDDATPLILTVSNNDDLAKAKSVKNVAYFLAKESWVVAIQQIMPEAHVLVAIEKADQVNHFINDTMMGIALTGSLEISPGLKDYDHLAEVLESLEVE